MLSSIKNKLINAKNTMSDILVKDIKHAWVFLYAFIYIPWFLYLEKMITNTSNFKIIHCKFDDLIPFCEIFVLPYIIWFAYVAIFIGLFFFISKDEFYKITAYMFIGMTICLIIYTVYPNGHDLRLSEFPRNNIFTELVNNFYTTDTCTNVLPSIHSFNSLVIMIAVFKSTVLRKLKYYKATCITCTVTTILIMLSTVFIKQHSVLDMVAAIILSIVMYPFVYVFNYNRLKDNSIDVLEQEV